ncbi:FAD:protein FMN transferase [Amycolatopsis sp. CA-161197]|uniref:FAD:protein FMN transferase n=1 Tax=Amycolatopsis sp. CA-161197 TaxID=3239922 RepID=UPI003D8AFD09
MRVGRVRERSLGPWVGLASGAVTTSTPLRRRWRRHGLNLHHLIDPATGRPSSTPLASATVVGAQAHWAEVVAKAAVIAGLNAGMKLVAAQQAAALLVTADGTVHRAGPWERYERWTPACGGTSPVRAG